MAAPALAVFVFVVRNIAEGFLKSVGSNIGDQLFDRGEGGEAAAIAEMLDSLTREMKILLGDAFLADNLRDARGDLEGAIRTWRAFSNSEDLAIKRGLFGEALGRFNQVTGRLDQLDEQGTQWWIVAVGFELLLLYDAVEKLGDRGQMKTYIELCEEFWAKYLIREEQLRLATRRRVRGPVFEIKNHRQEYVAAKTGGGGHYVGWQTPIWSYRVDERRRTVGVKEVQIRDLEPERNKLRKVAIEAMERDREGLWREVDEAIIAPTRQSYTAWKEIADLYSKDQTVGEARKQAAQ